MNWDKRQIITVLLVIACTLSGIILAATPPLKTKRISTEAELDSLISISFGEANFRNDQIRTYTTLIDTVFSRKTYQIRVTPYFSKTSLHLDLHKNLQPYRFTTPARVTFPERNMNIYITYRGTVLRTIRLITDFPGPETEPKN